MVRNEKEMKKHYKIMRKNKKTEPISALIEKHISEGTMYRLK